MQTNQNTRNYCHVTQLLRLTTVKVYRVIANTAVNILRFQAKLENVRIYVLWKIELNLMANSGGKVQFWLVYKPTVLSTKLEVFLYRDSV